MPPLPARAVMILLPLAPAMSGQVTAIEHYKAMDRTTQLPYGKTHKLQDGKCAARHLRIGLAGTNAPPVRSCGTP